MEEKDGEAETPSECGSVWGHTTCCPLLTNHTAVSLLQVLDCAEDKEKPDAWKVKINISLFVFYMDDLKSISLKMFVLK